MALGLSLLPDLRRIAIAFAVGVAVALCLSQWATPNRAIVAEEFFALRLPTTAVTANRTASSPSRRPESTTTAAAETRAPSSALVDAVTRGAIISTAVMLPACLEGEGPQFAYLVTLESDVPDYGDYRSLANMSNVELITVTWKEQRRGSVFNPGATFTENRNLLLDLALQREQQRGCRFTYYIYLDEHVAALEYDAETARVDGLNTSLSPHEGFQRVLLDWNPAIGYTRYSWMPRLDPAIPLQGSNRLNFDHVMIAVHYTAARLMLPMYAPFDAFHWVYGQQLFDTQANTLFMENCVFFRSFVINKIIHPSSTQAANDAFGKPWNTALMDPFLLSTFKPGLMQKRVWPWGSEIPQVARRAPSSVRYDVDLSALVRGSSSFWRYNSDFWARHGTFVHACGGGFCDLRDENRTSAYVQLIQQTVFG